MKSKFIQMILINCISYTVLSFIISILSFFPDMVMEASHWTYLSFLIVTSAISILITFTSLIRIDSFWIENFVILIDIFIGVYGIGGGLFHWFPWQSIYIVEVGMIALLVGIITGICMYFYEKTIADKINRKLEDIHHGNNRS